MIIDANLAIKENLQNIFLLEFDLNNYNKDNSSNNGKFIKLLIFPYLYILLLYFYNLIYNRKVKRNK